MMKHNEITLNDPFPKPAFDRDGYPTRRFLKAIEEWKGVDVAGLLRVVRDAWEYGDEAREVKPNFFVFATCGWSGNENLLAALNRNPFVSMFAAGIYVRGGLQVYAVGKDNQAKMQKLYDYLADWAWEGGGVNDGKRI